MRSLVEQTLVIARAIWLGFLNFSIFRHFLSPVRLLTARTKCSKSLYYLSIALFSYPLLFPTEIIENLSWNLMTLSLRNAREITRSIVMLRQAQHEDLCGLHPELVEGSTELFR
jgi:hypothetical protein